MSLLVPTFLTTQIQSLLYLDPALDTRDSAETKLLRTLVVCQRPVGRNSSNTVEIEISRKVTPNLKAFIDGTKPLVVQRVSTRLRSVEMVDKRGLGNFSDV